MNTAVYSNSQRTKPPYSTPEDYCLFQSLESQLPVELCDCFMALLQEEILPSWCIQLVPIDEIKKGATKKFKKQVVTKPKALMCMNLILLLPKFYGNVIQSAMTIANVDYPIGKIQVWDVDSDESYSIIAPPNLEGSRENLKLLRLFS